MTESVNLIELSAVGIIFVFAIKEFFLFLRTQKEHNGQGKILGELKLMNANHLNSIESEIREGSHNVIQTINYIGQKQIEILSRIEGKLDK